MTTMHEGEQLPLELLFEADGHVTEVVLACLADGELAIVPEAALDHVTACEGCTRRLGAEALLSVGASEALREHERPVTALAAEPAAVVPLAPAPASAVASSQRRRPLPLAAIAAALAVAALTAGSTMVEAIQSIPSVVAGVVSSLPFLFHVVLAFLRGAPWGLGGAATAIKVISAVVFVTAGFSVARAQSRWGRERPHTPAH
jgi:hypothetical protein